MTNPLTTKEIEEIEALVESAEGTTSDWACPDMRRLIATVRKQDERIEELASSLKKILAHGLDQGDPALATEYYDDNDRYHNYSILKRIRRRAEIYKIHAQKTLAKVKKSEDEL